MVEIMRQRIWGSEDTVKFFRAHSFIKVALQSAVCHIEYYFAQTALHANTYCNESLIWFKVWQKWVSVKSSEELTYLEYKLYSQNYVYHKT